MSNQRDRPRSVMTPSIRQSFAQNKITIQEVKKLTVTFNPTIPNEVGTLQPHSPPHTLLLKSKVLLDFPSIVLKNFLSFIKSTTIF